MIISKTNQCEQIITRKCRCGSDEFNAHQLTRHDVIVDAAGAYKKDIGVYDAEYPYGPFTCTQCGAEFDELEALDEKPVREITTTCVNGELRVGDLVISIPNVDYACLVGTVMVINLLGTPEHDAETENETDDVHVNFVDTAYSKHRMKEISDMFSDLYGTKKKFWECPIDDAIMAPEFLIRITGIDDDILMRLLRCEESARLFCQGVQAALIPPDAGAEAS